MRSLGVVTFALWVHAKKFRSVQDRDETAWAYHFAPSGHDESLVRPIRREKV